MTAIFALDISADGTALPAPDLSPLPAGEASYRWMHFDMGQDSTRAWIREHLPEIAAMAMVQSETRPRSQGFDAGLLVNLRAINLNEGATAEDMVSLRLWMTDRLVVTGRFRKIFAIEDLRAEAESGAAAQDPASLVAAICHRLTNRIEEVSLNLEDRADALEDQILANHEAPPEVLADLRRKVIRLRRHIVPSRDALHVLASPDTQLIGKKQRALLRESANRMDRSVEEIVAIGDRLTAIADQIDALAANRIGRNGYVLSVVAAIFLPLGFLTGLFGMNVGGLPLVESEYGFFIVSVVMLAIGIGLYALFRARRWF